MRWTLAGGRQQDAVSPWVNHIKGKHPLLRSPKHLLLLVYGDCGAFITKSSRFLVITSFLHISTHAAALFWFSLLSADSHCRALQDYPFRSCWGCHGQVQLVLGDWWPVQNGLGGSILSQSGRYKQPKECQHQCLPTVKRTQGLTSSFFPPKVAIPSVQITHWETVCRSFHPTGFLAELIFAFMCFAVHRFA